MNSIPNLNTIDREITIIKLDERRENHLFRHSCIRPAELFRNCVQFQGAVVEESPLLLAKAREAMVRNGEGIFVDWENLRSTSLNTRSAKRYIR